jgi:hypothetical protein
LARLLARMVIMNLLMSVV